MKNLYKIFFPIFISMLMMIFPGKDCDAQCPWGYVPDGVAFDTTIYVGSGKSTKELRFPKFDPQEGMVTCMKLTMSITGIMVNLEFENEDIAANSASATYTRKDTLIGPALGSPLTNSFNHTYGPYNLNASDGVPNSGPDYFQLGPDTIMNATTLTTTITDTADLSVLYGPPGDSLSYFYTIDATTFPVLSGNFSTSIFTAGYVTFKLEYCYCPAWLLPLNLHRFEIDKVTTDKAELKWSGLDDGLRYHYEVEFSRDGRNFTTIASLEKNPLTPTGEYQYVFTPGNSEGGMFFFRIKQVWSNGYTQFSEIKSIELEKTGLPKFNLYPNPSTGIVGIKFDNILSGNLSVLIINAQGQTVLKKEIEVLGPSYRQIATLQRGVYWLRLTDVTSHLSCVNQLLIK